VKNRVVQILIALLLVSFTACNTSSGEAETSSSDVTSTTLTSQTEESEKTTTEVQTDTPTSDTEETTTKAILNDQIQGDSVPTPPDFGLGF
jgi:hypothetical protein